MDGAAPNAGVAVSVAPNAGVKAVDPKVGVAPNAGVDLEASPKSEILQSQLRALG